MSIASADQTAERSESVAAAVRPSGIKRLQLAAFIRTQRTGVGEAWVGSRHSRMRFLGACLMAAAAQTYGRAGSRRTYALRPAGRRVGGGRRSEEPTDRSGDAFCRRKNIAGRRAVSARSATCATFIAARSCLEASVTNCSAPLASADERSSA